MVRSPRRKTWVVLSLLLLGFGWMVNEVIRWSSGMGETQRMLFQLQFIQHQNNINAAVPPENFPLSHASGLKPASSSKYAREREEESFSACLLVMNENPRLPEWLAYHYYMLPLRHLILLVDPRSEESPMPIIEKWREFMEIEVWNDTTIRYVPNPKRELILQHRSRQIVFYQKCARHLQHQNRTWTSFFDVDEYLGLDPIHVDDARQRMGEPGSILTFLKDIFPSNQMNETKSQSHNNPRAAKYAKPAFESSCFYLPRTYFGSKESDDSVVQKGVPKYLNGTHFETLRFLHRTSHEDRLNNGNGKSLVDVSLNSKEKKKFDFTGGIHRLLKTCPGNLGGYQPFRIRHYLGSWEAYTSRVDSRTGEQRCREIFEFRSQLGAKDTPDDDVRMWLDGFLKNLGAEPSRILHLLEGVGQVPPRSEAVLGARWSLTPSSIQKTISTGKRDYAAWLNDRYNITKLPNKTLVAERTDGEPYPYSFS